MKPRIEALSESTAPEASADILRRTQSAIGMTPNLHRTLAHAPAALAAYAGNVAALAGGVLDARLRESIAVAIAAHHGCAYCASAHTAIGKGLKIEEDELARNLDAGSSDERTAAALRFAVALVETRGDVPGLELEAIRAAGFSEAEIVEIAAHVGLNTFTNLFNRMAHTEIDFPRIELSVSG